MNTRPLRDFIATLGAFRDQVREHGDPRSTERLDPLIERGRALADELDELLARLGNPPSER